MANCGKHFKCVSASNFRPLGAIALGLWAAGLIITDLLAGILGGAPIPGLGVVGWALFIAAVFDLCRFLHGGKLVCLGDNSCAIGRIMNFVPVGADKSGLEKMDDDFCINILLSPHSPVETRNEIISSDPNQGKFIDEQDASKNLGLPYEGEDVEFSGIVIDGTPTKKKVEVLHTEIKGCRVHDVCNVLKAMSIIGLAVPIICSIPIIGWIACLIALAIWAAITLAAVGIAWAATHNGHINDVYDPSAGELKAADPVTGEGGDVILVRGDWVFDAGHAGWNEIQPVRHVQKLTNDIDPVYRDMAKASAELVEKFKKEVLDVWCFYVGQGADPDTKIEQDKPKNRWHIHPLIDGCDPDDEEVPEIK